MRTTIEYLDAVKAKLRLRSDNAASTFLGVSRSAICRYRKGLCAFDDDVCFEVARILNRDPLEVLISAHAERAKTPDEKSKWIRHWDNFKSRFDEHS